MGFTNLLTISLLQSKFLIVFLKNLHTLYSWDSRELYLTSLFTYSLLALFLILLSPSPKPQWFPPDSHNDPEPKGTTTVSLPIDIMAMENVIKCILKVRDRCNVWKSDLENANLSQLGKDVEAHIVLHTCCTKLRHEVYVKNCWSLCTIASIRLSSYSLGCETRHYI